MLENFKQAVRSTTLKLSDKAARAPFVFGSTIGATCAAAKYLVSEEPLGLCVSLGVCLGTSTTICFSAAEGSGPLRPLVKGVACGVAATMMWAVGSFGAYYGYVEPKVFQIKNNAIVAQAAERPWREGQQFRVDGFLNKNDVVTIKKISDAVDPATGLSIHRAELAVRTLRWDMTRREDQPIDYQLLTLPRYGKYKSPAP